MIDHTTAAGALALDSKGLGELRGLAKQNSPEAIQAAARHFEALFLNMMLKSMRDATSSGELMDSEQSRMYTSILDQQLSQSLASRGVGLADILVQQLKGLVGSDPGAGKDARFEELDSSTESPAIGGQANLSAKLTEFQSRLATHAEEASRITGIPAEFMIGHAALETGWGRREIAGADGTNSHNLFGIKATGSWKGRTVEVTTTEYLNGEPKKVIEKFRAYDSYADAFKDYASLLRSDPRYKHVLDTQDPRTFAEGLQRGGYATDPSYADKLARVIKKFVKS